MRRRAGGLWLVALALVLGACGDDPVETLDPVVPQGGSGGDAGEGGSGGEGGAGGQGGQGGEGGEGGTGGDGGGEILPPIELGEHLRRWGPDQGIRRRVWSVSADRGGNVWAADLESLLLLRRGSETWEFFTEEDGLLPYPILSVAGGEDLEVYVGYEGLFPDDNPFDDPPEISKSGDVDRIRLRGGALDRFHYDLSSPPSDLYPEGRDILRSCYRIVPVLDGPFAGDVWFGCNHGVAMWSARFQQVIEHLHPAINIGASLFTGDFRGIAIAPDGNVWVGGAARTGLVQYATEGGNFWARISPELDVWPEGVALDPEGHDWVMALAADDAGGLWVASFGNGLAYRAPDGSFRYLTTADGLPDNRIRDLALDLDGSLWVAAGDGLVRVVGGRVAQVLGAADGLAGSITSVFVDRSQSPRRLIIGTTHGIAIYDGP